MMHMIHIYTEECVN